MNALTEKEEPFQTTVLEESNSQTCASGHLNYAAICLPKANTEPTLL